MTSRQTLATYGDRGARVRVLRDGDRILVQWYDRGRRRKRLFPNSRIGQREALAFAEGFVEERDRATAGDLTVRQVWTEYAEVCFPALRPRTRELYLERWRKWEAFIGRTTPADAIELRDVDRFVTAQRRIGATMNQTRHVLAVVRIVYNWARSRKHIADNALAGYRWKTVKGEEPKDVPEHTPAEWAQILSALDPTNAHQWRPWALLTLAGIQGPRIKSARYLRWQDIDLDRGVIVWPAEFMKQGEAFVQPLTQAARRALTVAREYRDRAGYDGPYVFFSTRRDNAEPVYTYQSAWIALRKAERRAGVRHVPFRAFHGFRRMAAGNVYDLAKDPLAAAEWIGDRDVKQMRSYLKRRGERLEAAAAALDEASRGGGSNPEPAAYEAAALPLSYHGGGTVEPSLTVPDQNNTAETRQKQPD